MGESPIPLPYANSVPNRAVRVVLPASVANDLGKMQRALANLAEQFGCPDCLSGVDCAFEVERSFVIDAKTLTARGRHTGGSELSTRSRSPSVRAYDKPYPARAMDKASPVRALDKDSPIRALDKASLSRDVSGSSARDIAKAARDVAAAAREIIRAAGSGAGRASGAIGKATRDSALDKATATAVDKATAAELPSPDAVKSIADVIK